MGANSTKHVNEVMNDSIARTAEAPAVEEAQKLLEISRNQIFIEDDAFVANPLSLLGRVLEMRRIDEQVKYDFHAIPVKVWIDEKSTLKQPLKTKSFIVNKKISSDIGFLSFLKSQLDSESLFSVIVFNQEVGLIDIQKTDYIQALKDWINIASNFDDNNVEDRFLVTGVVQKNIIRKKYKKFDMKIKGGAYGLNYGGSLYTSTEDYTLDIRFGLSVQRMPKIKESKSTRNLTSSYELESQELESVNFSNALVLSFNNARE